jgi:hypothetical protein
LSIPAAFDPDAVRPVKRRLPGACSGRDIATFGGGNRPPLQAIVRRIDDQRRRSMTQTLKKGDAVEWKYGKGKGEGKVEQKFTDAVTKTIKGKEITRKATDEKPAFLVKQEDGAKALKSRTELKKKS